MKNPKLSVVMPVFNSEKYLKQSVKSVLNQTYKDFEFIIINDGSTDKTLSIIKTFKDSRIKIISNKKNLGVAKSLNLGLKKSKGEYVARFDGDDISFPDRFETQVNFLNKNKEYVLVGSQADLIDGKGNLIRKTSLPESDLKIRNKIIFRNPIIHPSVMFRKNVVFYLKGYREIFNGAEDYDLWFRLLKFGKFKNFSTPLIKRRWHSEVVTQKNHIRIELKALFVRIVNLLNYFVCRKP